MGLILGMEEKLHGGKRLGAGRKPATNKKKQVTLYVEAKLIFPFGTEEKMKAKLYEFIREHGNVVVGAAPQKQYDAPKLPDNFTHDEPLSFAKLNQQATTQAQIPLPPQMVMKRYWDEKRELMADQYPEWLSQLYSDQRLTIKQKDLIKNTNQHE